MADTLKISIVYDLPKRTVDVHAVIKTPENYDDILFDWQFSTPAISLNCPKFVRPSQARIVHFIRFWVVMATTGTQTG